MSVTSILMNRSCTRSDRKRDAGLSIPEEVEYCRDIRYGSHEKYHTLDICWPRDREKEKLPVIISFHGGGYVYGSSSVYQFYAADLARRGFAVVNFNYRLAPKYKFPAPLEDLNWVLRWIMENRENYPVDLENVFMVGDSAGAQLVSQYGVIYSNREYRKLMGFRRPRLPIRGLGLCCGMYDLAAILQEGSKGVLRDYFTSRPEVFGEKLNVLHYIDGNYPPVYIFSAKGDFLMDQCEPMANLLQERGVETRWKIYGDENTGHVFHVDMNSEAGRQANDDQTAFFLRLVKKEQKA